jgi:hypothetical protein
MKTAVDTEGHRPATNQPTVPRMRHIADRTAIGFQAWMGESVGFMGIGPNGRNYSFFTVRLRGAGGLTCAASAQRPSMS